MQQVAMVLETRATCLKKGIWTIAPEGKLPPGLGWGSGQGQGYFKGWGQPDNCPREKLPPG